MGANETKIFDNEICGAESILDGFIGFYENSFLMVIEFAGENSLSNVNRQWKKKKT